MSFMYYAGEEKIAVNAMNNILAYLSYEDTTLLDFIS